jgi:hypothetical protein
VGGEAVKDLIVIVPSRGRPERFAAFLDAWNETTPPGLADLLVCLDDDDPTLEDYPLELLDDVQQWSAIRRPNGFAPRLTEEALNCAPHYRAIATFGDDHLPRTPGWDELLLAAMENLGAGIVYPNDLYQGSALPTAALLDSSIVRALGFYAPPCLAHSYVDNFWLELGLRIGRIRYVHDVVIEHVHPAATKAAMDDTYAAAHSREAEDAAAWRTYVEDGLLHEDCERVRAALGL